MATIFPFTPSSVSPFQFTPTLDGQQYNCIVTWNLFGKRWWINLYTLANVLVLARAMVGSAPAPDAGLNMVEGYFSINTLIYRTNTGSFEVGP